MPQIFLIIVIVIFALAIANLIVGVSNDAVNFLNSAIGSKAGNFKLVMVMASIGLLLGALSSTGMMEIARKGLFFPQYFTFSEVIYIFFAVILTNIILLDFFNTFGLPTSTTVSLVFSLLGAALAIATFKQRLPGTNVLDYINSEKALTIISGILLSVILSFALGTFLQWIVRIIFSFNYEKNFKYFGSIWGGIALTAITFFLFINGLKGSSFTGTNFYKWTIEHQGLLIIFSLIFWTGLFQILIFLKINILKIVVLIGTMALAMAFAGNDLLNFIGVPLAALSSYHYWHVSNVSADSFLMQQLNNPDKANLLILVASAVIMIITLWTSKKAKYVTQTEINLSRQDAGYERFGSTQFSRVLVRWSISIGEYFNKITPLKVRNFINKQYDQTIAVKEQNASYDLVRASVNLVSASILIAIGTSFKLPLSTTYVTFIVAMGSSLADKAWGKESAVYRVSGVISVITGWFVTALIAIAVAFIVGIVIFFGKFIAMGILILIAILLFLRSNRIHKKRVLEEAKEIEKFAMEANMSEDEIFEKSLKQIISELEKVKDIYDTSYNSFAANDRKVLKIQFENATESKKEAKLIKQNVYKTVKSLSDENLLSAQYYTQIADSLRELSNSIYIITERLFSHIDNNHDIFENEKFEILNNVQNLLLRLQIETLEFINKRNFNEIEYLKNLRNSIMVEIEKARLQELSLIQKGETDLMTSDLYLNMLSEYKNVAIYTIRIIKAIRRYIKTFIKSEV